MADITLEQKAKRLINSILPLLEKAYKVESIVSLRKLRDEALKSIRDNKVTMVQDFLKFIDSTYKRQIDSTDAELRKLLKKKFKASFNKPHKEAIAIFQDASKSDIETVYNSYNNSVSAYFSRARISLREKLLTKDMMEKEMFKEGKPSSIVSSNIMKNSKNSLSSGTILAGKRSITLDSYMDMLVRTIGQATLARAAELRLMQNDVYHIKISSHNSKDWCALYEGKVFSLRENDPLGYPHISVLPNGGTPFHPNCLHSESPFIPDMHDPETLDSFMPSKEYLIRDTKSLRQLDNQRRKKLKEV